MVAHAIWYQICAGTAAAYATSAAELGPPFRHLRRDWAHPSDTLALRELLARIVIGQVGGSLQVEPKWDSPPLRNTSVGSAQGRFQGAAQARLGYLSRVRARFGFGLADNRSLNVGDVRR